ncbi:MAG: 4-hydroxybenzoate 3-monooxygenase [Alphaproteobacteria bacterium]
MRTQVAIIGAGPAGLLLAHLLQRAGIESVILEARDRAYVEARIRAGVLEQQSVDLLRDVGLGARLDREGLRHEGVELAFNGARHRIDLAGLTGGKAVTVYGQHEAVKDMIAARVTSGAPLLFDAKVLAIDGLETTSPSVTYSKDGQTHQLHCAVIAGCDGFHGVARASIAPEKITLFERVYPFAWLGILAEAAPASHELIYARHDRGFALFSMRSPTITRLYLQCPIDDQAERWSDQAIWDEIDARMGGAAGWTPKHGPIIQKSVTPMRSFVAEPMRFGRLFLAGDAAHIVPPTGAKGMNLAVADVRILAQALEAFFHHQDERGLDRYSATCLDRIWKVQRFSWWMTAMLHRFDDETAFDHRRQLAELDYVVRSKAAATSLAENYVGLPFTT